MAAPDTSNLRTVDEAFGGTYTIPQIRAIHKSLHSQIDEKASRLRMQVGQSYRELLGTADTIVQMRDGNNALQSLLGDMGAKCGRSVIGAKVGGMTQFSSRMDQYSRPSGGPSTGHVARIKILESCSLVARRILGGGHISGPENLGRGASLVLATKVLALGRLLITSFANDVHNAQTRAAVQHATKSIERLRNRLFGSIKRLLERDPGTVDDDDILRALESYALATNSGARDVLKYFLKIRGQAVACAFEIEESEKERETNDVVTALNLYTKTLLDVQTLVPYNLSEALLSLKKTPLLSDKSLKQLDALRLDVYGHWCGEEAQFYSPFLRHDDLDVRQAKDMLTSWAEHGAQVLVEGLEKTLGQISEFRAIIELRNTVFQLWIQNGGRAKGFDPTEMLDDMRRAVNDRLLSVLESKVNKLRLVGSEVASTLEAWKEGTTDQSPDIWDLSSYDLDLGNGAPHLIQQVVSHLHGRNDAVSKAANSYHSWRRVVDEVEDVVENMRKRRWDNDFDDIEDEDTIEARHQVLSKDDPKMLKDRLQKLTETAFQELDERLSTLWEKQAENPNKGRIAMFVFRVVRDIRSALPGIEAIRDFGLAMVPQLQQAMVAEVCVSPLDEFSTQAISRRNVPGRDLWEGSPELPTQPSLGVVLFLRSACAAMSDAGLDLWSADAVQVAKQHLRGHICEAWKEAMDGILASAEDEGRKIQEKDNKTVRGEGDSADEEAVGTETQLDDEARDVAAKKAAQERHDLLLQWTFDIAYLRLPLGSTSDKEFQALLEIAQKNSGLEDDECRKRITKGAEESWKRTSLLFGLLA